MSQTHIPRSSLQHEVTNRLRFELVEGHWRPGTRLQERALCERYGISRSPLREAFQILATEGLIDITLNKGAIVSAPTVERVLQNFIVLRALESLAVQLASRHASDEAIAGIGAANQQMNAFAASGDMQDFFRANNEVHRLIVLASGNKPLADMHLVTSRQIIRVQNLDGPTEHIASEGVGEHDEFIAALEARDAARAEALFAVHMKSVEDNLRARLRQWPREETRGA